MNKRQAMNWNALQDRLVALGFDRNEAEALIKIERTLSRWGERECGDEYGNSIERDEVTGKPYMTYEHMGGRGRGRYAIPDREAGAIRRLNAIMAKHPTLWAYHQGDPRGCGLYVGRYLDLPSGTNLSKPEPVIDQYYTRGVGVCY